MVKVKRGDVVWYRCIDNCLESYYKYEADSDWNLDIDFMQETLAEEVADDYHSMHDGWECSWPLTFSVHASEGGPELFRCIVSRESNPEFSASVVPS